MIASRLPALILSMPVYSDMTAALVTVNTAKSVENCICKRYALKMFEKILKVVASDTQLIAKILTVNGVNFIPVRTYMQRIGLLT